MPGPAGNTSLVPGAAVAEAVARSQRLLGSAGAGADPAPGEGSGAALVVVDAFKVPRYVFDLVRRQFCLATGRPRLHAPAEAKVGLYRDRFALLQQRILRNRKFTRPVLGAAGVGTDAFCELTQLQALLGTVGETRVVMGALSQLEDGCVQNPP